MRRSLALDDERDDSLVASVTGFEDAVKRQAGAKPILAAVPGLGVAVAAADLDLRANFDTRQWTATASAQHQPQRAIATFSSRDLVAR